MGAGFGSLAAAKKAGWRVSIRNIGPPDWWHFGAWIAHPDHGNDYLQSRKDDWMREDAKRAALERINEMMQNTELSDAKRSDQ